MSRTWQVMPDGSYRRIEVREDLLSEARCQFEDLAESVEALLYVGGRTREVTEQSRGLVGASRRERRLRLTTLRLVKPTIP